MGKFSKSPKASSVSAQNRMKAVGQRDTSTEIRLQSELKALGVSFLTNHSPIPDLRRTADIVIESAEIAIFVDGCFWHGCPLHGTWPKENADFWRRKILANQKRDRNTDERLVEAGWKVIRVWEHEDMKIIAQNIFRDLENRTS